MLTNPPPSKGTMPVEPEQDPKRAAKRRWSIFGIVVLILAGYIFFVFWTRHQDDALIQRERAEKAAAEQRDVDQKSIDALGGTDFKILAFYAGPPVIKSGDTVDMCYGVSNANSVAINPPVGNIWVSTNHCLQIHPTKTTKYVFTTEDGKGNKLTADLTITVK
jgi:hypothetical protein